MPLFKFEDFIFDSTSHRLTQRGTKVSIRPKALKLLSLLIKNRHRIVSKAEIMSSVWGSDYARDHLLFQLIGELRKPPFKSEFVRTQPNEGYQWNIATKVVDNNVFSPKLIAASFVTALVCVSLLSIQIFNEAEINQTQTVQLPAYGALSKGVIALENGEKNKAIYWFEFALKENPDSVESSIFLAETLHQQNRLEESSAYLQDVLDRVNLSAYNKATATNLLSRIREQQGRFDDALRYAQKSIQTEMLGQCSADFVERRLNMLENQVAISPTPSDQHEAKADVTLSKNYVDQCNQLKDSTVDTTSCQPLINESIVYARGMNARRSEVS